MTNTNDSPLRPDDLRFLVEEARAGRVEVLRGREHITAFVRASAATPEQKAAIAEMHTALDLALAALYDYGDSSVVRDVEAALSAIALAGLTEKE